MLYNTATLPHAGTLLFAESPVYSTIHFHPQFDEFLLVAATLEEMGLDDGASPVRPPVPCEPRQLGAAGIENKSTVLAHIYRNLSRHCAEGRVVCTATTASARIAGTEYERQPNYDCSDWHCEATRHPNPPQGGQLQTLGRMQRPQAVGCSHSSGSHCAAVGAELMPRSRGSSRRAVLQPLEGVALSFDPSFDDARCIPARASRS